MLSCSFVVNKQTAVTNSLKISSERLCSFLYSLFITRLYILLGFRCVFAGKVFNEFYLWITA